MKLYLTPEAIDDLNVIYNSVAMYVDTNSAESIIDDFFRIIDLALSQPEMGTIGLVENTRELFPRKGKYRIVYRIKDNKLEVLNIVLSKRKYPIRKL